jgi:hypothetical protein
MLFNKDHKVPNQLQVLFIVSVAGAFLLNLAETLATMFQQSYSNPNFSSFTTFLAWQAAVPLILFGLAYYLNPRKLKPVERLFESLIITITGLMFSTGLLQIIDYITARKLLGGPDFMAYQLVSGIAVVAVYTLVLWQLRKSKQWK